MSELRDAAIKLQEHAWLARFREANYENKYDEMSPIAANDIASYVDRFIGKVLAMTDPTPFDEQWLREVAAMADDTNDPAWLVRGNVKCRRSYSHSDRFVFWILGTKREPAGGWAKPNPRTRGEVLWLLEQVNAENNHDQH